MRATTPASPASPICGRDAIEVAALEGILWTERHRWSLTFARTKKLNAIKPNPTAVSVNASTSGTKFTFTSSSSFLFDNRKAEQDFASFGTADRTLALVGRTKAVLHATKDVKSIIHRRNGLMVA